MRWWFRSMGLDWCVEAPCLTPPRRRWLSCWRVRPKMKRRRLFVGGAILCIGLGYLVFIGVEQRVVWAHPNVTHATPHEIEQWWPQPRECGGKKWRAFGWTLWEEVD